MQARTAITVPKALWERVKKLPLDVLGYASPTEFVRGVLREKCDALEVRVVRRRSR